MSDFILNSHEAENNFLDTVFDYISFSGDSEKIKTKIGLKTAAALRAFLSSFAERNENALLIFAKEYFEQY